MHHKVTMKKASKRWQSISTLPHHSEMKLVTNRKLKMAVHTLQVLHHGCEIDHHARMEDLRVLPQKLRDGRLADAHLPHILGNGGHVLRHYNQVQGVIVDVLYGDAKGMEEVDALPHDIDGDGELKAIELVGDDAETTEELVGLAGALVLHLGLAGPPIEG